jgi:hypothetical protein
MFKKTLKLDVSKIKAIKANGADDDGGWHEGVSYWAGYQAKAVWWLQVANSALGIDGLKKPFFGCFFRSFL